LRLVTDASGNIIARHDFLPFGEEIPGGAAGRSSQFGPTLDNVTQKFTGQERDTESLFDWFQTRYTNAGLMGRFNSPDGAGLAAADPTNPQSWNQYAYVWNNPLNAIDPSGMACDPLEVKLTGGCGPQEGVDFGSTWNIFTIFSIPVTTLTVLFSQNSATIYPDPDPDGGPGNSQTFNFPPHLEDVTIGNGFDLFGAFSSGQGGPQKTETRPCASVDPRKLDYLTPRFYGSEGRTMTPAQHIMEGHILPNSDPKSTTYVFGNPITGPSSPLATLAQVLTMNRATFSSGKATVQGNTNIQFQLNFPPISIDMGFGVLTRYGIGKDKAGNWLTTNTLVVASNCTSVVTSYPSKP
jgi:RHS repeat-associated protein